MSTLKALACNTAEPTRLCVTGSLCYVLDHNHGEVMHLLMRSGSGRSIVKWERLHRLKNFRVKTVVPESGRYEKIVQEGLYVEQMATDEWAKTLNDYAEKLRAKRAGKY